MIAIADASSLKWDINLIWNVSLFNKSAIIMTDILIMKIKFVIIKIYFYISL